MNNKTEFLLNTLGIFMFILFIGSIFMLGWYSKEFYQVKKNKSFIEGLRFEYKNNQIDTMKKASELEPYGDWVCINVKGMDYKRCVEVSQHECGHEIFAEILEDNPEKIEKVMGVIKDEN